MGACLWVNLFSVCMCAHMHVFCMSREEYAQLREACRLPRQKSSFPILSTMSLLSLLLPRLSKVQPSEVYHQGLASAQPWFTCCLFCSSLFLLLNYDVKRRYLLQVVLKKTSRKKKHNGCQGKMHLVIYFRLVRGKHPHWNRSLFVAVVNCLADWTDPAVNKRFWCQQDSPQMFNCTHCTESQVISALSSCSQVLYWAL